MASVGSRVMKAGRAGRNERYLGSKYLGTERKAQFSSQVVVVRRQSTLDRNRGAIGRVRGPVAVWALNE